MRGRALGLLVLVLGVGCALAAGVAAEEDTSTIDGRTAAEWAADLGSEALDARRKAAFTLWNFGPRARPHVRALAKALRDDDDYIRSTVEKVLVRFEWQRSLNTLSTALPELIDALGDERVSVRIAAVNLIWNAGPIPNVQGGEPPPEALLPALVKALQDDDGKVRSNAAAALANLQKNGADALPALEKALRDPDPQVRTWSVRAVSWIAVEKGVPLVLALAGDTDAGVRTAVYEACASAGAGAANTDAALAVLQKGLQDPVKEVRRTAATSLWGLGRTEAIPALARALAEDEAPEVRNAAASTLGGLGDASAVPHLLKALEHEDDMTRAGAASGVARLGPEGVVALPKLIQLLRTGSNSLRSSVLLAIGMMGKGAEPALPALIEALQDEDPGVRSMAASSLSGLTGLGIHSDALRAALTKAINDDVAQVRQYAVDAAYNLGPDMVEAVPALLKLHADGAEHVGDYLVCNALRRIGPAANEALPALRRAMASEHADPLAPLAAAAAVAVITDDAQESDRALQHLIDALADERLRSTGFYLLQGVGPRAKRAALILRVWMKSSPWKLRAAAALLSIEGTGAQDAAGNIMVALAKEGRAGPAMRAIAELDAEKLRPFRERMLTFAAKPSSTWRTGALAALIKMGARGDEVRAIYTAARKDKQPYIRTLGARGLASLER